MFSKNSETNNYSLWAIVGIALFFLFAFIISGTWNSNRMLIDGGNYYGYLPAAFIYHDLHLNFVNTDPQFFSDKIWFDTVENGNRFLKHSCGLSIMLSPFFLAGHLTALLFDIPANGYSMPFQNAVSIGILFYLISGLLLLRKVVLQFFNDGAIAITLFAITIGTNLFYYSLIEPLMAHSILFSCFCFAIYGWFKWIWFAQKKHLLLFAFAFSMCILIRSSSAIWILFFLITGIQIKGGFNNFIFMLRMHLFSVTLSIVIAVVVIAPQLLYNKYITGSLLVDPAPGEHFIFSKPAIAEFLFSFRKGWLIYTPVLIFAVAGFVALIKVSRTLLIAILFPLLISIYLLASWWAWSYGICFGMRSMIEFNAFLSFPFAASVSFLFQRKRLIVIITFCSIVLLTAFNLFQSWQYKNGLIHFDNMTKKAYMTGLFQTKVTNEWLDQLHPYDWERRKKGLPQVEYNKAFFDGLKSTDHFVLRNTELKFLSASPASHFMIQCDMQQVTASEIFSLEKINGDTVVILASNGNYLSVKSGRYALIAADAQNITMHELFVLKQAEADENKITLRAMNGKYLRTIPAFNNRLSATGDTNSKSVFRLFLVE